MTLLMLRAGSAPSHIVPGGIGRLVLRMLLSSSVAAMVLPLCLLLLLLLLSGSTAAHYGICSIYGLGISHCCTCSGGC